MVAVAARESPQRSDVDRLRRLLETSAGGVTSAVAPARDPFRAASRQGIEERKPAAHRATRVIAVTSGKGGVGKTNLSVNLAIALGQAGHRVVLLEGDLGLANVDVVMGIEPEFTLEHVLKGERELADIVVAGTPNVRIVPGASGIRALANLTEEQCRSLVEGLEEIAQDADFLLIDTAAGIADDVVTFLRCAHEVLLVTTPDPTAITDAYALLKVLGRDASCPALHLVVNHVASGGEAGDISKRILDAAKRFLQVSVDYWGFLPADPNLAEAVRRQVPAFVAYPFSPFSRQLPVLVRNLEGHRPADRERAREGLGGFLRRAMRSATGQSVPRALHAP